jgi:putative DNA primase/helicase
MTPHLKVVKNDDADDADDLSRQKRRLQIRKIQEAAIAYAERGYRVLPVHGIDQGKCACLNPACKRPGKHPATPKGVLDASNDVATVKRRFAGPGILNVAIATGKGSGVIALDIDPRNGGDVSYEALKAKRPPPRTVRERTGGGGQHLFFAYPEDGIRSRHGTEFGPGIDLLSDGNYVVVAPSMHVSGAQYTWLKERSPLEQDLGELPAQWRGGATLASRPPMPPPQSGGTIPEGKRNTDLTQLAGRLLNAGLDAPGIFAALTSHNAVHCIPPLDDAEVRKIADSVAAYAAHPTGGDEAERVMHMTLEHEFAGGAHIVFAVDGSFWHFGGTHWTRLSNALLEQAIQRQIAKLPSRTKLSTSSLVDQTRKLLRGKAARDKDVLRFNATPLQVVNVLKGELWLDPKGRVQLRPHRADSFLRACFNVTYDPAATAPLYSKSIREIFSRDDEPLALVDFWHELAGYIIQPSRPMAKIVMGRGQGGDGKTSLLETLMKILGSELVLSQPVRELERSGFSLGNLLGKFLFLDEDLKAGEKLADGLLKKISERKTLSADKKYGDAFTFESRVVPIILFNNPPSIADLSNGMRRRLVVIPFERAFRDDEIDPQRFEKIWKSELPGILNLYLAGLQRLATRGWKFDPPASVEAATNRLLEEANPAPRFIADRCSRDPRGRVVFQDLYDAYTEWCGRNGVKFVQQSGSFKEHVAQCGFKFNKGSRGSTVLGLSLNPHSSGDVRRTGPYDDI